MESAPRHGRRRHERGRCGRAACCCRSPLCSLRSDSRTHDGVRRRRMQRRRMQRRRMQRRLMQRWRPFGDVLPAAESNGAVRMAEASSVGPWQCRRCHGWLVACASEVRSGREASTRWGRGGLWVCGCGRWMAAARAQLEGAWSGVRRSRESASRVLSAVSIVREYGGQRAGPARLSAGAPADDV